MRTGFHGDWERPDYPCGSMWQIACRVDSAFSRLGAAANQMLTGQHLPAPCDTTLDRRTSKFVGQSLPPTAKCRRCLPILDQFRPVLERFPTRSGEIGQCRSILPIFFGDFDQFGGDFDQFWASSANSGRFKNVGLIWGYFGRFGQICLDLALPACQTARKHRAKLVSSGPG